VLLFAILFTSGYLAVAQQTTAAIPSKLSISFHPVKTNPYRPFSFPLSKTIDYSNYPMTAGEILRRESQISGYNRMYNMITNKNKNGFIGNLLGLQRIQKPRPSPKF
jgi:hypothetical protein